MSNFGTFGGSMTRAVSTKIWYHLQDSPLRPSATLLNHSSSNWARRRYYETSSTPVAHLNVGRMENFFISALITAGTCPDHVHHPAIRLPSMLQTPFPRKRSRPSSRRISLYQQANMHSIVSRPQNPLSTEITKNDYLQLLDYYRDPSEPGTTPIESTKAPVNEEVEAHSKYANRCIRNPASWEEKQLLDEVAEAIRNEKGDISELYELYKKLPFPGVQFLGKKSIRKLLHRLSVVNRYDREAGNRYLSLVDDMKTADIPMIPSEWNTAVHLVGYSFSRITALELESALKTWKEMEQITGFKGTYVTLNILFDLAVKAGQFTLVDMIIREMKARSFHLGRFTQIGLIYYHGLKGDGDGVRDAYRNLVESETIVDTAVLNCVIASLLRAGEQSAAEAVFQRMKTLHQKQTGKPARVLAWRDKRELGRFLDRLTRVYRENPEQLEKIQEIQSLAPDVHTYIILVEHHVSKTGELKRVVEYLDELLESGLPIHGRFFMELFRGFACHGKLRYSSWTESNLRKVFTAFFQQLDDQNPDVYIGAGIAVWALRAAAEVLGPPDALKIWEELKSRWKDPKPQDLDVALQVLQYVLNRSETNV